MCLLIFATDWGKVGVIAAIVIGAVTILVTIGVGIYTVVTTRAKARVKVMAYSDETGHIAVVVTNERGTNPITITSVGSVVRDSFTEAGSFAKTTLGKGETHQWDFDIDKSDRQNVKVRVDSGRKHWVVRPELGEIIVRDAPVA